MAVTQAERQRRLAEKKRDAGLLRLCRWVKPYQKTNIDAYLRGDAEIKLKVEGIKVSDN